MPRLSSIVLLGAFTFAMTCATPRAAAQRTVRCGAFDSDSFRYGSTNSENRRGPSRMIPRGARTLAGIPAQAGTWSGGEYGMFSAFAGSTLALMVPVNGESIDARLQNQIVGANHGTAGQIFVRMKSIPIFIGLTAYTTGIFVGGFAARRPSVIEYGSLMLEALAVTQIYHVGWKFLLGRESPYQGDGSVHGPTRFHFPGGTPSGHTASVYAVLVVAAEYWDSTALRVVTHIAGLYMGTSLILHRQHFLSDVVWGAGMGYFVGRWVVRHHSSRFRCASAPAYRRVDWMITPVGLPGGVGLTAMGRF